LAKQKWSVNSKKAVPRIDFGRHRESARIQFFGVDTPFFLPSNGVMTSTTDCGVPVVAREFTGQVALVTGGSAGIGQVVAAQLAAGGARVIITGRDHDRGQTAAAVLAEAGAEVHFVAADLGQVRDTHALVERALDIGDGRVDILVTTPPSTRTYPPLTRMSINSPRCSTSTFALRLSWSRPWCRRCSTAAAG
jgi:hypothetical protein